MVNYNIDASIVYGVSVKLPNHPAWKTLAKRLEEFDSPQKKSSPVVDVNDATQKDESGSNQEDSNKDDGVATTDGNVAKKARRTTTSTNVLPSQSTAVLISCEDTTENEKELFGEYETEYDEVEEDVIETITENSKIAINKILNDDEGSHGLSLRVNTPKGDTTCDGASPIMLLVHRDGPKYLINTSPGANYFGLNKLGPMIKEDVNKNIHNVMSALGIEAADNSEIGWLIVVLHSQWF